MRRKLWHLDELLDAIDGISYVVDQEFKILAVGRTHWEAFAASNDAPELTAASVLGRDLLEIVQGNDVRDVYRHYAEETLGSSKSVALAARCDSPSVRRELRVAITPLRRAGAVHGLLFQSLTVDELVRPPIDLFDFKAVSTRVEGRRHLPIITLCSFCQRVNRPATQGEGSWIDAEEYYRMGGTSDVRISHGLCPDCENQHYEGLETK
jgi:hypothetical protein